MNFLITLIYMYIMITFIYPIVAKSLNINNRLGFSLFVIVSFIGAYMISVYFNKKALNFAELLDKSLYNSLILITGNFVISDIAEIQTNNTLLKLFSETSKTYFGRGIILLLPILGVHLTRALLKPF